MIIREDCPRCGSTRHKRNGHIHNGESGRFRGVMPLSWPAALPGGMPGTSPGRCSPTARRAPEVGGEPTPARSPGAEFPWPEPKASPSAPRRPRSTKCRRLARRAAETPALFEGCRRIAPGRRNPHGRPGRQNPAAGLRPGRAYARGGADGALGRSAGASPRFSRAQVAPGGPTP